MSNVVLSHILSVVLSMGFADGCATAPAPEIQAPPADPVVEKALDEFLDRWEKKSAEVQTMRSKFSRVDTSELFGRRTEYSGVYTAKGGSLALMSFRPKGENLDEEQILVTSDHVYQFRAPIRQVFVFPKSAPKNEKADAPNDGSGFLQRLYFWGGFDEYVQPSGPLFFFKINAKELKEKYQVELLPERRGQNFLRLTPIKTSLRNEFSQVQICLDKETLLPVAVKVWSLDQKCTKLFTFSKITINPEIADSTFVAKVPEGWRVTNFTSGKPAK